MARLGRRQPNRPILLHVPVLDVAPPPQDLAPGYRAQPGSHPRWSLLRRGHFYAVPSVAVAQAAIPPPFVVSRGLM